MRLNVKKSATMYIKPAGKGTYVINDFPETPSIGGEEIPRIGPEDSTKYIGSKINPWVTVIRDDLGPRCTGMLEKIGKARLKPRQMLQLLKQYALPKLIFPLSMEHYPKGDLKDLDVMIRKHVKSWLKLPPEPRYKVNGRTFIPDMAS